MQNQLSTLNMPFERVSGIDGYKTWDQLSKQVDVAQFECNVGRSIMPGEIGCYASHMAVWDRLIASDAAFGLILEDDVVFHDDFPAALNAALEAADQWDILKLNKIRAKQPRKQANVKTWHLNAYLGPFTGMGAYLIHRDIAAQMRPALWPPTRPIDHELDRPFVHSARHFGLEPWPSHVQDHGESTITGQQFAKVQKFRGSARLPYQRLRLANMMRKAWYMILHGQL